MDKSWCWGLFPENVTLLLLHIYNFRFEVFDQKLVMMDDCMIFILLENNEIKC